jgi:glycine dehydrogenase subunit 1
MPYIQNTEDDVCKMLQVVGIKSIDELFSTIPSAIRLKRGLALPPAISEYEAFKNLTSLSDRNLNLDNVVSFLGGGYYDHIVPEVVNEIAKRGEFYTAYTPYQPEASQGTLQAIFEYQTMICELTGMDVSNASCYDGATAMFEGIYISLGETGCNTIGISNAVNPEYRKVVGTYLKNIDVEVIKIPYTKAGVTDLDAIKTNGHKFAGIVVQNPNFFGCIEDVEKVVEISKTLGALGIICVDPVSLAVLKSPGGCGADIAVGEGQSLGIDPCFGGPGLGFLSVKKDLIRKMPGRLVGETVDLEGKRGFVLTLQTREQHIRRGKATSNICTNHGLMALRAGIYLSVMGKDGLENVAKQTIYKSHYLAKELQKINGVKLVFDSPFFGEFVARLPVDVNKVLDELLKAGIFGGIPLGKFYPELGNSVLISVTEKNTKAQMDLYVEKLKKICQC